MDITARVNFKTKEIMSLFKRVLNIVKSNINSGFEFSKAKSVEQNDYSFDEEDLYYSDAKDVPKDNKEIEYYKILELEYGASFKDIKSSYRRLLKKYHPDLFVNDKDKYELAKRVTQKINEAYTYFERKYL